MQRLDKTAIFRNWIVLAGYSLLHTAQLGSCEVITVDPYSTRVTCLEEGYWEGVTPETSFCRDVDFDEGENYGFLPSGSCANCGEGAYDPTVGESGKCSGFPAVTFIDAGDRFCGCNIGYYGNQSALGCSPCPAGTTTRGYGATTVSDCNICAVGYKGTASTSCQKCPWPETTAKPGNNQPCVCQQGYIGQPGSCKECVGYGVTTSGPGSQQCICPAGGSAPFCKPCTNGVVLNGKCVCPRGKTGKWPNCKFCPASISYRQTTARPGNNQKCECELFARQADRESNHKFLEKASNGGCQCKEDAGYYLKVVPNLYWYEDDTRGPCDTLYQDANNAKKLITINGRKRLGCDTSRGFGASIANQLVYTFSDEGQPLCIKCDDDGAYIDAETSRCMCSSGWAVNPAYHRYIYGEVPGAPFDVGAGTPRYCMRCNNDPMLALGTIPKILSKDKFCRCNWEKGWAGNEGVGCYKCSGNKLFVDKNTGDCRCKEGFKIVGDRRFGGTVSCVAGPTCQKGWELNEDRTECVCNLIQEGTQCNYPSNACKTITLTYWKDVTSADGKFPMSVLASPRTFSTSRSYSSVESAANLLDFAKLSSKRKVAVYVETCFCSRTPAYTAVELSSVGSASLSLGEINWVSGEQFRTIINQEVQHSKLKKSYAEVDNREQKCLRARIYFYSGNTNGVLKYRKSVFAAKTVY